MKSDITCYNAWTSIKTRTTSNPCSNGTKKVPFHHSNKPNIHSPNLHSLYISHSYHDSSSKGFPSLYISINTPLRDSWLYWLKQSPNLHISPTNPYSHARLSQEGGRVNNNKPSVKHNPYAVQVPPVSNLVVILRHTLTTTFISTGREKLTLAVCIPLPFSGRSA
jgi:hypothetical protein